MSNTEIYDPKAVLDAKLADIAGERLLIESERRLKELKQGHILLSMLMVVGG